MRLTFVRSNEQSKLKRLKMELEYKYKVLGVNDDKDFCTCCGKPNLARVVWLENMESGEVSHSGTKCASKLAAPEAIKRAEKKANQALVQRQDELEALAFEAYDKVKDRKNREILMGQFLHSQGITFRKGTNAAAWIKTYMDEISK